MEINQSTKSMVISDSPQGSVSFTFTYDPMVGFEDLNRWFSWLSWFSWKFYERGIFMENAPYLCGSFFYGLLLHVKSDGVSPREHKKGIKDTVNASDIFWGLSSLLDADAPYPTPDYCSKYLKGEIPKRTVYLSVDDAYLVESFDQRVKNHYADELQLMHDNVVRCLKDSDDARRWLAQTLMRVIHDDDTLNEKEFYCRKDGTPINRDDLLKQSSVCLEALLLGIWHFLIINRKERDDSVWPDMFERYFEHEPQRPWDVRQGVLKPWTTVTDVPVYKQTVSQDSTDKENEENSETEYVEAEIVDEEPHRREEKSGTVQNISIVNNGSGFAAWSVGSITINTGDKK